MGHGLGRPRRISETLDLTSNVCYLKFHMLQTRTHSELSNRIKLNGLSVERDHCRNHTSLSSAQMYHNLSLQLRREAKCAVDCTKGKRLAENAHDETYVDLIQVHTDYAT